MKILEEISGILSAVFMVSFLSRDPAVTLPIIALCALIGTIISLFFSQKLSFKKTTKILSISIISGSFIGIATSLFSPYLSYWIASAVSFLMNLALSKSFYTEKV